ncbi:Response regulator receiver modulated serine phosphatase [Hyella patelloides LEGE 07179]|uniref:Response regulator receiver modulated serine phosphatase n=1 Tax=Hyella patelloides LEGE 07179 TaxID=945734 RepID=A0A563VKK2_9CYAN|nr:SpoIIE family protein phosphatase [Hyella patelloides]VEP11974.1 Response regulator receiver modulated serine phosphatase [Hyella patelloides LEGE 07179]
MALILIIDDDSATQLLLKRTLEKQGYEIAIASDGQEGLAKAIDIKPALIICDWIMPHLSGLEVCRKLKAIAELSTTFFILLTSLDSLEARVQGLDAGSDDFLCKPIEMYELTARVRAGLRLHELSRDLQQQKQLLEDELTEAAEYVSSILPEPLIHPKLNIDMRFIPSRQLGGDSFDYFWLDNKHLVFYLLDVAGHGLRASLPSLSVINLLRSQTLMNANYYQPSSVISSLNSIFQMSDRNDKYFTIWYGVYNCQQKTLTYSSAGHPPGILLSDTQNKQIIEQKLKTVGVPVGMFPKVKYVDAYCTIPANSSLYIFSDGIYEVEQVNGYFWGLEKFISVLKKYQQTPQRNLDRLLQFVRNWHPNFQFEDDLSILQIDFL